MARISLIALYTIYGASVVFPIWMYFADMEYDADVSILVNLGLIVTSFLGLVTWRAIYRTRYPRAARSIRNVMLISGCAFLWLLFYFGRPSIT